MKYILFLLLSGSLMAAPVVVIDELNNVKIDGVNVGSAESAIANYPALKDSISTAVKADATAKSLTEGDRAVDVLEKNGIAVSDAIKTKIANDKEAQAAAIADEAKLNSAFSSRK